MKKKALWTSSEADLATGGRSNRRWEADGVSIDTRTLEPGDLFVAIEGPNFDGHAFAAEAFERGAAAVIASRPLADIDAEMPVLIVADTMLALTALARAARGRVDAHIIAVTGSVGKSGVKEALKLVLADQGRTTATVGNLNNDIGVPLSLARMSADVRYAIFEMGMNHAGELSPLARLVRPEVSIITTIAPAHTEFFDSIADIADAKAEIFDGMVGGSVALNRDNAYFATLAVTAFARGIEHIAGFGAHPEATARVIDASPDSKSTQVTAEIDGTRVEYRVGLPGRHWVINSLAVLAAVKAVGGDIAAAATALDRLEATKGRGTRHRVAVAGGEIEVIDESYNASPASMRAAFDTLDAAEPGAGGRRIAVLGDMLELGANSETMHAGLAGPLEARGIDLVFTAGAMMAELDAALPDSMRGGHAASAKELMPVLVAAIRAGDVIVIKGSLGSRMSQAVETLLGLEDAPAHAING